MLQCVAKESSELVQLLQCIAVCCSVLQKSRLSLYNCYTCAVLQCVAEESFEIHNCCSVLQCGAVCCIVLQCVAEESFEIHNCCSVLQCAAEESPV